MMASLRGGDYLWGSKSGPAAGVNQNAVSAASMPGDASNLALFITCDQGAVFSIQASGAPSPTAGLNAISGSLVWYDYHESGSALGVATITFAGSGNFCFDLSPFAPQYIRLKRTDGGTVANVTAWITAVGPN